MRYVKFESRPGFWQVGVVVGLVSGSMGCDRCDSDTPSVAIRTKGYGLMLCLKHPSYVEPITRAQYLAGVGEL